MRTAHQDLAGVDTPVRGENGVYTGVAARLHPHGDPLRYPEKRNPVEYRDEEGLRQIADTIVGRPVTLMHPGGMLADGAVGRIVGKVLTARVDGDRVVVTMHVDGRDGVAAIDGGIHELSIGYMSDKDESHYQRNIQVDHLAIVPRARCGATCRIDEDDGVRLTPQQRLDHEEILRAGGLEDFRHLTDGDVARLIEYNEQAEARDRANSRAAKSHADALATIWTNRRAHERYLAAGGPDLDAETQARTDMIERAKKGSN